MKEESGIKFEGYKGKWYKINEIIINEKTYKQFESEKYGDEAPAIITENGSIIIDDSYNDIEFDVNEYLGE